MTVRERAAGPVVAAVCAVLLTGCTARNGDPATPAAATTAPAGSAAAVPDVPTVIRAVEPSVVTVFTPGGSLGSGVIYREDGTIIMDEHVVNGAESVEIGFADGQRLPGRLVAADPGTDLAVVQVQRSGLPAARFQAELPQVGELAIALGSPLGFEGTATAGIVSGLGREIPGSAQQGRALVDLIQTDAPISPGNSGGALVDGQGDVIGINDAYIPPSAGAVSLGFAIPAATVVDVVEQLLADGEVVRPFVGIRPGRITPQIAEQLGLARAEGVLVLDVVEGSPAAAADLGPGDVVVALGESPVASVAEFLGALRGLEPGQRVTLVRLRQGAEQTVQLTLGESSR